MNITVGGEKRELEDSMTITKLIEHEKIEMPEYVTVSINEEFIQRDDFDTHTLNDGDSVEFLYFMGGGCLHGLH